MKRKILCVVILIFAYFLIGAIAPFVVQKNVSKEYASSFNNDDFYGDKPSVDRASILESNQSALDERIRLLDMAKERIILSTFDMRDGESTRDILSVILAKAEAGVNVKIIVDGFNGPMRMDKNPLFHALSSHPNVEIKMYNPLNILVPWKTQGRMHDKYIIVDDISYILGGRNTFDYFVGEYETKSKSLDREVLVYNGANGTEKSKESSLYELETYFNEVWNLKDSKLFNDSEKLQEKKEVKEITQLLHERYEYIKDEWPQLFDEYSYEDHTVETKKITLLSNDTHLYGKEPKVFYSLVSLMEGAKKDVVIHSPYAVFDKYMLNGLQEVSNNVEDFKMIINSVENGDNFFASSDYLRNKKKIIDTGAEVYEYDGGISYHGKSITVDDNISVVGSFNFDMRSAYVDTELMLVINSEELTKELNANMAELEKNCRRVIDEDNYEVPDHIEVAKVHPIKRFLWWLVGLLMQPFRVLV